MERGLLGIKSEPFLSPGCFDRCRRWGWQIRASIRAVNRFFRPHSSSGADQDTTASADERRSGLSPNPHQYPIPRYGWEIVASSVELGISASAGAGNRQNAKGRIGTSAIRGAACSCAPGVLVASRNSRRRHTPPVHVSMRFARSRIFQKAWSANWMRTFSRLGCTYCPSAFIEWAPTICTMASGNPTVSARCTP